MAHWAISFALRAAASVRIRRSDTYQSFRSAAWLEATVVRVAVFVILCMNDSPLALMSLAADYARASESSRSSVLSFSRRTLSESW